MFLLIKDGEALQKDLNKDDIITKEMSTLVGHLALKCGRLLMVLNTALITTKHVNSITTKDLQAVVEQTVE